MISACLLILLGGCSADPAVQEQIDLRSKELDAIEKANKTTLEALLGRIEALRAKMDGLIGEVRQSLMKKIEEGENGVMARLSREAEAIAPRITEGFAKVGKYMAENSVHCYDYIDKAFGQLDDARDVLASRIEAAAKDGDFRLQALLESYAKEADRVVAKASKAAASVKALDDLLAQADEMSSKINAAAAVIGGLDEKYRAMEESQLKLMEAVKEKTSDISSLQAIEDEHLRELLQNAESLIDEIQDHKDRIESSLGESENIVSEMEDLLGFIEDDVIDGVGATMSDASDSYANACELLDYFESFDISEYYDMIDEAFSAAEASYDDAVELMDDLESQISQAYSDISDSLNACESNSQVCQDCYNDSQALYDDIMSVHS